MSFNRYLFTMPDKLEPFLAALATVYTYRAFYAEQKLPTKFASYLQIRNPLLAKLVKQESDVIVQGRNPLEADFEFIFDEDRAFNIGGNNGKHITQCMGIMLGIDVDSIFPPLVPLVSYMEPLDKVVCICEPGREEFWRELVQLICNDAPGTLVRSISSADTEENLRIVESAQCVVGDRCGLTYYACCASKRVFEIYHKDKPRTWLSKWSNKQYVMIYGEPTADLVLRGMNAHKWKQLFAVVGKAQEIVPQ